MTLVLLLACLLVVAGTASANTNHWQRCGRGDNAYVRFIYGV